MRTCLETHEARSGHQHSLYIQVPLPLYTTPLLNGLALLWPFSQPSCVSGAHTWQDALPSIVLLTSHRGGMVISLLCPPWRLVCLRRAHQTRVSQ